MCLALIFNVLICAEPKEPMYACPVLSLHICAKPDTYCVTYIVRQNHSDNMLFLEDGTMRLADFGLARMYGTPKTRLSPQAITLWYKPPELLLGASEYSAAADMWSVGCIFAELLLRRPFLQGNQTDISQLDTIFKVFGTPNE